MPAGNQLVQQRLVFVQAAQTTIFTATSGNHVLHTVHLTPGYTQASEALQATIAAVHTSTSTRHCLLCQSLIEAQLVIVYPRMTPACRSQCFKLSHCALDHLDMSAIMSFGITCLISALCASRHHSMASPSTCPN
jgi:hypothetical protein